MGPTTSGEQTPIPCVLVATAGSAEREGVNWSGRSGAIKPDAWPARLLFMVGLCDQNAIILGRNLCSKQPTQKNVTISLDMFEMELFALLAHKAIGVPNSSYSKYPGIIEKRVDHLKQSTWIAESVLLFRPTSDLISMRNTLTSIK